MMRRSAGLGLGVLCCVILILYRVGEFYRQEDTIYLTTMPYTELGRRVSLDEIEVGVKPNTTTLTSLEATLKKSSQDSKNRVSNTQLPTSHVPNSQISNTSFLQINRATLYAERCDVVKQGCLALNTKLEDNLRSCPNWYIVEPKHDIMYCPIEKVASTFWKRVLTMIGLGNESVNAYKLNWDAISQLPTPRMLSQQKLNQLKEVGTSLLFIREPYTRLFSAYVDKIYSSNLMFWRREGAKMVKIVRNSTDPKYRNFGFDVTFAEFIQYVLHEFEHNIGLDVHFTPMHRLCDPCKHQFGYIGKLETLQDDYNFLIDLWRKKYPDVNIGSFADFAQNETGFTAKQHLGFTFETRGILSEIKFPFSKLMLRAWRDLQIRGYISKWIELPIKQDADFDKVTVAEMMVMVNDAIASTVNKTAAKLQREEALIQAYRTVSVVDMDRLSKFVAIDCTLFGYDSKPDKLFNRSLPVDESIDYLAGLHWSTGDGPDK